MTDIDMLEFGGGAFTVLHHGELITLPDPRDQHYQWVLMALYLGHVPGTPSDISDRKRAALFERWRIAWDLPVFRDAQRLTYLVEHYRSAINYDLATMTPHDLGALWRGRRWRLLLDIIDHLPSHSWYAATASMDEDHAKMLADAIIARQQSDNDKSDPGPSLVSWTPEVAVLNNIYDAIRGVQHAVIAAAVGDKAPKPPEPAPRPVTPLQKALKMAEFARRKRVHESLAARVLPGRANPESPVH